MINILKNTFLLFVIFSGTLFCNSTHLKKIEEGDIIFHESQSRQSKAIKLATNSRYSHMGIIVFGKNKQPFVFEAVEPVKLTPLRKWIQRGAQGHFVVKRLKKNIRILTPEDHQKMKNIGMEFKGKHYDKLFQWSDTKIYCSELVWKIYKRALNIEIGKKEKLKDFNLSHPFIRKLMKERYGKKIPYEEDVISPEAIYSSELLYTVIEEN